MAKLLKGSCNVFGKAPVPTKGMEERVYRLMPMNIRLGTDNVIYTLALQRAPCCTVISRFAFKIELGLLMGEEVRQPNVGFFSILWCSMIQIAQP
jgi:hypothetical protein